MLIVFLGIAISSRSKPQENKFHFSNHYKSGSLLEIKILEGLKRNDFYDSYLGEIKGVDGLRTNGKILIRVSRKDSLQEIEFDDKVYSHANLTGFKEPMNPGEFNFKEYAKKKGLNFQLKLVQGQFFKIKEEQWNIRSKALMLREKIIKSLRKQEFSPEEFMIIEALLLGKRQDLSKEITQNYKNAGAMHILAISGLHIGILLMILHRILKPIERIKYGKRLKLFLLILCLWSFAFLSGLSASVIRAVAMFSVLTIGIVSRRSSKLDHYLFVSLFISLLIKPLNIFDIGFQLSYIAVISIIGIGPILKKLWAPRHKIIRYFWNLIVISFSAQLGILPLTLYYFHQFSGVFMASSLIVIPLLGLVLGGGYLMIFLDQINYLPKLYAELYGKLIGLMNDVIGFLGGMEFFIYKGIYFNIFLVFIGYISIYFIVKLIEVRSMKQVLQVFLCLMITVSFLMLEHKLGQTKSSFIVFNQYKQSVFLHKKGNIASIYSNEGKRASQIEKMLANYSIKHLTIELKEKKGIKHFYRFRNKHIMVIDHELIKTDFGFKPDIIVLIGSPKLNLTRILKIMHPTVVVADGSNYYSYKLLWEKTSKAVGVLFHDTSKDGAFILADES